MATTQPTPKFQVGDILRWNLDSNPHPTLKQYRARMLVRSVRWRESAQSFWYECVHIRGTMSQRDIDVAWAATKYTAWGVEELFEFSTTTRTPETR